MIFVYDELERDVRRDPNLIKGSIPALHEETEENYGKPQVNRLRPEVRTRDLFTTKQRQQHLDPDARFAWQQILFLRSW
jgi:hypothetical protein